MASFYAVYTGHFDFETKFWDLSRNFQDFGCKLKASCEQVSDIIFPGDAFLFELDKSL